MLDELLNESWAFQEVLQRGVEKGLQDGLKQGQEKGLQDGLKLGEEKDLEASRQTVVTLVECLYPSLVQLAKKKVKLVSDLEGLQSLILRMSLVKNEADAREYLQ